MVRAAPDPPRLRVSARTLLPTFERLFDEAVVGVEDAVADDGLGAVDIVPLVREQDFHDVGLEIVLGAARLDVGADHQVPLAAYRMDLLHFGQALPDHRLADLRGAARLAADEDEELHAMLRMAACAVLRP